jgi:D-galactose 1-dehydrogenase
LLERSPDLDCVAICTPPQAHFDAALLALGRGKHVLLEKPPAATTRQLAILADQARRAGRTLFQAWHSRFAAGVEPARSWLSTRRVTGGRIAWKEDVRIWHPGQRWIWSAGGFGVFDPGINALSILTRILPADVMLTAARLEFPSNCQAPIAADLQLRTVDGAPIAAAFDFRHTGEQAWDIELDTADGPIRLSMGGSRLSIGDRPVEVDDGGGGEYANVYRRFAALCAQGESEADARPFELVADAFLIGERETADPFTP